MRRLPRLPKPGSRAPLAIAAFLAIPLFFSTLMASALAQEKPLVHQWKGCRLGLCTTWHEPTAATEARIWLWALLPPLVLVLVGLVATRLPLGFYVSCVAACAIAMAVVHDTATWARHHTARYPWGVDLIPGTNAASNQWDPGEWEAEARETALSLQHWTIGVALAAAAVMAFLWARRRYFGRRPELEGTPLEGIHAPDATPPGL
ncbi:MAG TPA: hypothetical protein VFJ77_11345 [Gaiellaceae bacterium]|nr:hypothetical protein [Gaiellaceae bacterium]